MTTGFEKLRIGVVAGTVGVALVPLAAGPAAAAVQHLPVRHTGFEVDTTMFPSGGGGPFVFQAYQHSGWQISNDARWPTATSQLAYGIDGAGKSTEYFCSGGPCGGTGTTFFESAGLVRVRNTTFKNPDGTVDANSATVRSDSAPVAGLQVHVRHDFFGMDGQGNAITRVVATFWNKSSQVIQRKVQIGSRVHSGNSTIVYATSDGDSIYEPNDAWAVLDSTGGGPAGDVSELLAKGDRGMPTVDANPDGTGNAVDGFTLKIKPNTGQSIMYFYVMGARRPFPPPARVTHIANRFDNGLTLKQNGYLSGLTKDEVSRIVNWSDL